MMGVMRSLALLLLLLLFVELTRAAFQEEEVTYPNPAAPGVTLAGTITRPESDGTFPAVLLISASGPQDRDETIAGHKPFAVIAEYLTKHGILVLRVDDRGAGRSTGHFDEATTEDFATDAVAGVRFLLSRGDVDPKHVGLIGHGEGADIAAIVAVKMPEVSFMVMLGATGVSGEQVLLAQTERAEKLAQIPPEQIAADKKIGAELYSLVEKGASQADMRLELFKLPKRDRPFIERWERQLPRLTSPWLRFFLTYDPQMTLAQVKCPVLALSGEKDIQALADQNVPAIKAALAKSGSSDVSVERLPNLNFLFQTAQSGLGSEYSSIEETIAPSVLQRIQTWIAKHTS